MTNRSILWTLLAFSAILSFIWQFYKLEDAKLRLNSLPLTNQSYFGQDVDLNPFEAKFFEGVSVIKRIYRINGQDFFVTAVDGTENRHVVHDPSYCFTGGGWSIVSETSFPLELHGKTLGDATLVQLQKDKESRQALYWFSDGNKVFNSPFRYWKETAIRRLTLGRSGPEPILVMIQPIVDKPVDWKKVLNSFPELLQI